MLPIDEFAYIPLLAGAVLSAGVLIALIVIAARKTAKISFVFFLSVLSLIAGLVYTAFNPNLIYMGGMVFLGLLLLLLYCIVKAAAKPQKPTEKSVQTSGPEKGGVNYNIIVEEVDKNILDINKDFQTRSTNSFMSPTGLEDILAYYDEHILELNRADGVMTLLLDDYEDIISVKHLVGSFPPPYLLPENIPHKPQRVEMSMKYAQFPLKENIFGEVVSNIKPELITEPLKDERIVQNEKEDFLKCGSYMFIPLIAQDQCIGEIALSRDFGNEPFTEEQFETTKKLADLMALAIRNNLNHTDIVERSNVAKEGEIAGRIQKELLPQKIPALPGITVGTYFNAADNICGDFYDLVIARKDRIAFVLGDVTGKTLNSMTVMLSIRAMLRLVINTPQLPGTILTWANRGINSEATTDHFASISLLFYDSVSKKIQYSSGGTNPIYKYNAADKSFTMISDILEPVGVEKTTEYRNNEIPVASGDIIVTCSDGFIEAQNLDGEQFSQTRLEKIIKENHSADGKAIANRLKDEIKNFCGSAVQHDDQTVLVIKIQ